MPTANCFDVRSSGRSDRSKHQLNHMSSETNDITISTDLKRNSDGLDSSVRPIGRAYGRFVNGRLTSSNYLSRCMNSSDGKYRVSTIKSTYNLILYDARLFEVSRKIFVSQTATALDIHFHHLCSQGFVLEF